MAQQPGAQTQQATDMAQQLAQMMQALAQGQNQLQRAMAEAYTQQTAITRNIATSVEVRDRSELKKGTPKPDKFNGHTGNWDSWYFKFKTWIETSHKNAGKCIQLLEEHQDTEINETSLEDDYPEGPKERACFSSGPTGSDLTVRGRSPRDRQEYLQRSALWPRGIAATDHEV